MTLSERHITFDSGGLSIEGMLHEGGGDLAAAALHPHPQYGGDMDNHVVLTLCDALADARATTLRFNFRGTGRSQGSFDGRGGEARDALSAVRMLSETVPSARIVVAGYSFGAGIAALIAHEAVPAALVLVSAPAGAMQLPPLPRGVPALLVTGERDTIAPAEALRAWARPGDQVDVVSGADHGWWPGVDALTEAVARFVDGLNPVSPSVTRCARSSVRRPP